MRKSSLDSYFESYMLPAYSIVIPCYNESERLDLASFIEFAAIHPRVDFVMVNDGSTDTTIDRLEELKQRFPNRFQIVDLEKNSGKAEAVRQGLLHAFTQSPEYVGYWDADLATPLTAIPELANVLDSRPEIDLVLGSRLPLLGRRINRNFLRQKIGTMCGVMASFALGHRVRDTQCGAKIFRVTDATRAAFQQPMRSRWLFDVEFFARLIQYWNATSDRSFPSKAFEYPLQRWDEIPGSSLKRLDYLKAALELWSIYWRYVCPFRKSAVPAPESTDSKPLPTLLPLDEKRAA